MENIGDSLFIKELIREVHHQLLETKNEREKAGEYPIFEVDTLTIEANFIVTDSTKRDGGVDFKFLKAGINKDYDKSQVHKIILNLKSVELESNTGSMKFQPRFEKK